MRELIIAILLVILLPIGALFNSYLLTERCDDLLRSLDQVQCDDGYAEKLDAEWRDLKRFAAYSTPYDLVRNANNACEAYLARLEGDENPAEVEAALIQFRSAVGDLRRIHAFSLELIF